MATATIRDLLAGHRLFAELPDDDLDLIAGCGMNVRFSAGEVLFREGEPANAFYVVRRGRVSIETHAPTRPAVVITTATAGGVVGWSWLFPPHRWQFDAHAIDDTAAVALDGACLRTKCDADTDLGYRLMKRFAHIVVERLQSTRLQLLDVYAPPVSGRWHHEPSVGDDRGAG